MEIINAPIKDLKPATYNPRIWSDKAIKDLEISIQEFGLVDPIIVNSASNRKNIIIGGHFRVKIAEELGFKEVPVVYVNISDLKKEKELNLRLNKNLGDWNWDLLADFEEDLLKNVGFSSEELDKLLNLEEDEFDAEAEYQKIEEPKSKYGEVYQLGQHRLMCGDSTKREDVEKLMDGKKADMVFTDPPYGNLKITNKKGEVGKSNVAKTKQYYKYINEGDFDFRPCWKIIKKLSKKIIIWGGNYFADFLPITTSWIIWDKRAGDHSWYSDCELAWTSLGIPAKIYKQTWQGMIREGEKIERKHPTQKPIEMLSEIITDFSKRDYIIIDLFGGSGSTLIAAEQTNRICYMMELDPKYADVIRNRYEIYTRNNRKDN